MTPIFQELPYQLGVYTLTRLLELRQDSALYEAHQPHVDRAVILEILRPDATHEEEVRFLAQSRLRVASSELPHVAQMYESQKADGLWLLTQELPKGITLADTAAAGLPLSVPHLCNIIVAAAEMYELCGMVDLCAMPLASSSIFVDDKGTPHFLSPLVEGTLYSPQQQMQALVAALMPVIPQQKEPGLGRLVTLLHWMNDGYENDWLPWNSIGKTASTILHQLAESDRTARESTLHYKLTNNRLLSNTQLFISQWGTYVAVCGTIVVALTCLGCLFGLAEPEHLPAVSADSMLCHQDGINYRLMAHPVTVAEYARFLAGQPADGSEPADWEKQQQQPDAPVCGVTYRQAEMYAQFCGGQIPSANQLQLLQQQKLNFPCRQEWSSSTLQNPLPGVYGEVVYLLIDAAGQPNPVNDRKWSSPTAGFRLTFPESPQK